MRWKLIAIAGVLLAFGPIGACDLSAAQSDGRPKSKSSAKPSVPKTIDEVAIGEWLELKLGTGGAIRGELVARDEMVVRLRVRASPGSKIGTSEVSFDRSLVKSFKLVEAPAPETPKPTEDVATTGKPPAQTNHSTPEEARRRAERTEKVLLDSRKEYVNAAKRVQDRINTLQSQIASTTSRGLVIDADLASLAEEERSLDADLRKATSALSLALAQQRFERETIGRSQPITDAEVDARLGAVRAIEHRRSEVLAAMDRLVIEHQRSSAAVARWRAQIESFEVDVQLNQQRIESLDRTLANARTKAGAEAPSERGSSAAAAPEKPQPAAGGTDEQQREASLAAAYAELPPRERALRDAVVLLLVACEEGARYGSGFVVTDKGWVITNAHVVDGAVGDIRIVWDTLSNRRSASMTVRALDRDHDLALLAPTTPFEAPTPLRMREIVALGHELFAVGFPLGLTVGVELETSLRDITISSGTLSGVLRSEALGTPEWLRHDCRANSGASGGPLVDRNTLEVVGIMTMVRDVRRSEGEAGDVIQLAVPVRFAMALVDRELAAER